VAAFFGSLVALPADIHDDIAATALGPLPIRDANGTQGPATVLLRPEQIVLAPVTGDARSAVVVRVAFHGPDGVVELLVDEGSMAVTALPWAPAPAPGDRVGVGVTGEATLDVECRDASHEPDSDIQ
jgi:iron(III) transport system ATP-binding protein